MKYTYLANVFMYPFQCLSLIQETDIDITIALDFPSRHKAKSTNTVVVCHDNHVHIRCLDKLRAVVIRI